MRSWQKLPLPLKTEAAVIASTRCHLRGATKHRGCFEEVCQPSSSMVSLPQTQQMNQPPPQPCH